MDKVITDVDSYIDAAPAWAQPILRQIRHAIKQAAPAAKESISYHMPYYSQNGRLAYFAAYTHHCSFHWISDEDRRLFASELSDQKIVGSTLHLHEGDIVPVELIRKIVTHRLKTNLAKSHGK